MSWKERSYRVRSLTRPGVHFVGDEPGRVKFALALLGGECIDGTSSDQEGAEIILASAARCDAVCGGDERHVGNGYLLMRDAGVSDRVMFAIDCLRRAKRTRH